tara:strand:- start:539 stop:736 length:198 start_codon:yes stop_codon:yes gene_type:complete
MAKRFTFADAKLRIKELEEKVEAFNLNTDDHIYTTEENNVIKFLKIWAWLGPALGIVIGLVTALA